MKNLLRILSAFCLLILLLFSCEKKTDDDQVKPFSLPDTTANNDTIKTDTSTVNDTITPIPADKRIEIVTDDDRHFAVEYQLPNKVSSFTVNGDKIIAVYDSLDPSKIVAYIGEKISYSFDWYPDRITLNYVTSYNYSNGHSHAGFEGAIFENDLITSIYSDIPDYEKYLTYNLNSLDSSRWVLWGQFGGYGWTNYDCFDTLNVPFTLNFLPIEFKLILLLYPPPSSPPLFLFTNMYSDKLIFYRESYSVWNSRTPDRLFKSFYSYDLSPDGKFNSAAVLNLDLQIHPINYQIEDTLNNTLINYNFIYTDL